MLGAGRIERTLTRFSKFAVGCASIVAKVLRDLDGAD
jgi:hypothetical protein